MTAVAHERRRFTRCSRRSATETRSATRCSASSGCCAARATNRTSSSKPRNAMLEPLTRDYRELVDASHPDNLLLHHFAIGSKASRAAFALPDRMALIYHNITPPEYFIGVHRHAGRSVLPRPPRASRLRRPLRSRARRFRVQPAGSRGARFSADRRAAGRARLLAPRSGAESLRGRSVRRRLDQHPVRRTGDRQQEDRRS